MKTVSLHDAKTKLARLVERVAAGAEIVIAEAGRPLARLVPLATRAAPRVLGLWADQVRIGDDFDDPLPEDDIIPRYAVPILGHD